MRKPDESIYNIVVASIKRHSMDIDTWEKTKLWETGEPEIKGQIFTQIKIEPEEIPILYFWESQDNWTIYTTRAVYFTEQKIIKKIRIENIKDHKFEVAKFKGIGGNQIDFMIITDNKDVTHKISYETGKASMGAIYGIRTLIQIS